MKRWVTVCVLQVLMTLGCQGKANPSATDEEPPTLAAPCERDLPREKPPRKILSTPTNQSDCEAVGGRWRAASMIQSRMICDLPTADGGLCCTDSDQCESRCMVSLHWRGPGRPQGKCDTWTSPIGRCAHELENGHLRDALCAD